MRNNLKEKSRYTKATLKSFIRKNRKHLLINVASRFSGMTDMSEDTGIKSHTPAKDASNVHPESYTLGIEGVYVVGRDLIQYHEEDGLVGLSVYNCCTSFSVMVKPEDLVF